ncbi:MAG: Penicillin-binding protein 1A [Alphaproteobacteria bacterium MarineAlpha5_Bin7]|nr:MAG: Penicillin-binding protein 1A [Alphaproteobacteria bacterium MarineAlpha5_Bin7]|tara:strand:- start:2094 stop:4445 length:2352 start_codon:yes stop_codon:yes gene_type:complete
MKKVLNLLKFFLIFSLIFTFILVCSSFYILWKFSPELPGYSELKDYKPSLSTRVYTSDGLLLDKYFIEERIFVPVDRIPKNLINAFLSAEDKKFYSHFGIDPLAIFRATFVNIYNKFINNKMIGASTITQQVVKNLLLTNEVSFERKIKEMILAIRLEIILNKERILELYLNDIYLGYGSYGIAAASLNYFNKSLWDLSLDEMAFLAALPKAPNNYNPKRYYKKAIKRRNWVLDRMYENNFISIKDLEYKENKLIVQNRNENKFEAAKYFREETRKQLNNLLGYKELYNEGYIVKTTIDTQLQKIADDVFVEGLIHYDKKQGWRGPLKNSKTNLISDESYIDNFKNPFPKKWKLYQIIDLNNDTIRVIDKEGNMTSLDFVLENKWIKDYKFKIGDIFYAEYKDELIIRQLPQANGGIIVIDPHTGKILAITGGFSYDLSEFNRATQAWRQPGSAFKPFVYLSALKEGYTPSTLILDAPYVVDQGPGLPKWKPSNYTEKFYGISTMRTGIEKSRNLMTIRLSDKIGIQKILKTAKDFKIHQRLNDNLSMSLGAGLVTLQNITNAYAMIVNGGKEIAPTLIQSVYDKQGKLIINNIKVECKDCFQNSEEINFSLPKIEKKENTIIDSVIAYQMTSMLEGVVRNGTGKKISNIGVTLAGKTGTTNDNKDAWFIGFSPDLVVGVYVGYDKPKSLGYKQTGSAVAVPIFKNFMEKAKINKENIPFRIPSGISFVKIDSKTGLQTKSKNGVLEAFIIGTEPFNQNVKKLDDLGSINKDTISGTGSLLIN